MTIGHHSLETWPDGVEGSRWRARVHGRARGKEQETPHQGCSGGLQTDAFEQVRLNKIHS